MRYKTHPYRNGLLLLEQDPDFQPEWRDLCEVLDGISEQDLIERFRRDFAHAKSISATINVLIDERLMDRGWRRQSPIFADSDYKMAGESRFTLDFAKKNISVEVAFNHGEAAAWNLLKPVLASELNHVRKAIQTGAGVIVTATEALKKTGGFDGAVGTYEKYLRYLRPLSNILTVPMVVVGLDGLETFSVVVSMNKETGRREGMAIPK